MKRYTPLLILIIMLTGCTATSEPVKIIFDTDFGGDADDLGALAMLHNFIDNGECDLLAVMVWTTEASAVPAIDAVNRYYGHPDIPVGVRKDDIFTAEWNYSKSIADHFPYNLDFNQADEATALYRKILAEHEDQSVVIVTVGPLLNIKNLINSGPDESSDLTGLKLIERKVKEFVIMGGRFPKGDNEWNFNGGMPGVTKHVLENLAVPITFTGFEVGVQIKTAEVFNQIDPLTPLYVGFKHFSEHAPWMKANYKGEILDNSSFDQTGVLYAVRKGVGEYWERVENGFCEADDKGGNLWVTKEDSNHAYLSLTMDPESMATLIESIMLNTYPNLSD